MCGAFSVACYKRVVLVEAKEDARAAFDIYDARLVAFEGAKYKPAFRQAGDEVVLIDEIGRSGGAAVFFERDHYLPEEGGNLQGIEYAVGGEQDGPGEDDGAHLFVVGASEDIVFEALPSLGVAVEVLVLGAGIGEVEGIVVGGESRFERVAPAGILPPDDMAEVKIVVGIPFRGDLRGFGEAGVGEPFVRADFAAAGHPVFEGGSSLSVNVDGSKEGHAPVFAKNHRVMMIAQDGENGSSGRTDKVDEDFARLRQGYLETEEGRVIAFAVSVVSIYRNGFGRWHIAGN